MLALWQEKEEKGPAMRLTHPRQGSLPSWVDHLPIEGGRRGEMGEGLPERVEETAFLHLLCRGLTLITEGCPLFLPASNLISVQFSPIRHILRKD